jgi:hypothetical protein
MRYISAPKITPSHLNKLDKKAMLRNMISVIENQVSEATSARIE